MAAIVSVGLLLIGTAFVLIAAVGVLRLSDVLMRMHAATKAGTLGAGLILAAAGTLQGDVSAIIRSLVTILFIILTAPIGAHVIGRAAYRTAPSLRRRLHVDELGRRDDERRGGDPPRAG